MHPLQGITAKYRAAGDLLQVDWAWKLMSKSIWVNFIIGACHSSANYISSPDCSVKKTLFYLAWNPVMAVSCHFHLDKKTFPYFWGSHMISGGYSHYLHDLLWAATRAIRQYTTLCNIVSGWWFQPLWKILVSWDDSSQYIETYKMFQTTNQLLITSQKWGRFKPSPISR